MMMERILLGVLYLSGCNISSCLLHQYHYVADLKTWNEAQIYCRETYTDLATIENNEEINQLINTVSSFGRSSKVWIGLYTIIDWRWSDGYRGGGAEYRNWDNYNDNEPDFYSANQFCVSVGNDGGWWDDGCSREYPFICYRGTQLDPEFVVLNERMNWSRAQRYCRENFIDLATVRNAAESQKLQNLVLSNWAWIGLFRDPNIYWSDGSGSSFRYWGNNENLIDSMSVACGVAALDNSGRWKFLPCETRLPFVCYSVPPPPVMRQVVKLRMKPQDSSVDLNDPAVKADILKKLQDRLKEKGVSGVTLKWREQPDGRVFHKEGKRRRKKTEL
ncbi:lymphocyte antigen 75-like isoform X1 [Siniperca chuatsi]|uniref:lymphocyte antigen 75-like isoform X1 n=1 Tax=Siniperca chuatsi TaxID=119488 RepID=UPI001CE03979|nr:lymphocyte antigen 75-like isoform X1 [Siniperca chuatsi]